ncbi:MAG: hypothetical protein ACK5LT_06475 [Lachnospirales bacterium]
MNKIMLKYWAEFIFGIIILLIGKLYRLAVKSFKKDIDEQKIIKHGILALMQDRLYQKCDYHLDKGFISIVDRQRLESIYTDYKKLGGNGTGKEIYEKCQDLPLSI